MKTMITVQEDDLINKDYKKGDWGRIEGFISDSNQRPHAVISLDDSGDFVMIPLFRIKKVTYSHN